MDTDMEADVMSSAESTPVSERRRPPWNLVAVMLLTFASIGSILAVDATFNAPDASAANTPLCPVYNGTCVKLVGSFYVVEDSWSKRASLWDGWYKRCYERRTYTFYLQDHRYRQGQDLGKVGPVYISSQWKGTLTKRVPC